ncbi:MAG TPA: branched-chain amino acid ABC transporter substrate-binding protein, partial [Anaerolineae bacterium]|nr:branched-chain amino acid ABC transporter substrate-binding protein [Anaerolineae bacterium]
AAKAAGLEWYGPTGEEFTKAYKAAHDGEDPSYHVAGGYAAGLILQKAIETADSVDKEAVLKALDATDMMIFFGHIKFDTSAENHGLQIGHDMILIQWQEKDGQLVKEVVWPEAGATAEPIYPIR